MKTLKIPPADEVEIRGERVYLQVPTMSDYEQWHALRSTSADFIRPFEPTWQDGHLTRRMFRRRVRWVRDSAQEMRALALFIFRIEDDALIGGLTIENIRDWPVCSASIGFWIGKTHARQGYMTDALTAVVAEALETYGITRLEAACVAENEASRRLLQQCGFEFTSRAMALLEINGRWRDHDCFVRLHPERRDGDIRSGDT